MKSSFTLKFSWKSVVVWEHTFTTSYFDPILEVLRCYFDPLFYILSNLNFSSFIIYFFYLLFLASCVIVTKYKIYKENKLKGW